MSAHRPRVLTGKPHEFEALLLEAELHDVIVFDITRAQTAAQHASFIVVRDAAGQLCAQKLKTAEHSFDYRLSLEVTDQYVDAYNTFADVRAWFGASSRLSLVMELSPRDAGVLHMLGGRPLPPAVTCLTVECQPDAVGGYFILDECSVDDVYGPEFGNSLGWLGFALKAPGDIRPLHTNIALSLWHLQVPYHAVYLSEENWATYRSSPMPLAEHWRQIADDGRQRERVGEAFIYIESHGKTQHLQGPAARLSEQLLLIGDAAGLPGDQRFVVTPGQHGLAEKTWQWRVVSRRIVQAAAQLAQLEPRLSSYVMLWIIDRLPGCVFYPELRKLRCVEATADRIRAKLDERLNGPGPVNSKR